MVDYSPSAKKYSFQKRFNVSQGTSPMTIRTLFKKFQCTSSNEQVGSDGLKRIVIITKNFATVSEIVKKKKKNRRKSVRRVEAESQVFEYSIIFAKQPTHVFM